MSLETINPANGEFIRSYDAMGDDQVDGILADVAATQQQWRTVPFAERARLMNEAADLLEQRKHDLARLMADEMGKPLAGGISETEKCAWVCRYYADHAEAFLAEQMIESDASRSKAVFNPLGVVLAVMPWNFPLWQVFRFAAPGLMAGNGGVLKHASNVCGSALEIEKIFQDAGFPENLFRTLLIGSDKVARVIESEHIAAATLTGSTPAGQAVASKAGECLKKTVLELGGSDPYVVLADADMQATVEACVTSRLINSGQSCIAAKRFIVVEDVLEEFTEQFVALLNSKVMGDPLDEATDVGPQAREDLRDELHEQVDKSIDAGAECAVGGEIPDQPGAWYPPTVLTGVQPGMPAYDEELFGPVAAIIAAEDEADAIRIANDSEFGLGAAVFTRDKTRGEQIAAHKLEAGCCFVNSFVKSDPRLPFGGIKTSGYGRELSDFGIREFVNIKTVYVA